jgi:hypothetical protein
LGELAAVTMPALITVPNVDIVAAGQWDLSTGEATFTTSDLAAAVEAAQCPAVGDPILKISHDPVSAKWPAVGHVSGMALSSEGNKITGDLAGMPGWLAVALPSAYPQRSIEGSWDFRCQVGHVHPFVITALGLLGELPPGVGVLGSLEDVAALYGVAQVAAGAPRKSWRLDMSGGAMAKAKVLGAGVTTEDVRRAYYGAPATPFSYWITEMQVSPPQLIVSDEASAKVYRVPVTIADGGEITFGEPVEVSVEYLDVAARAGRRAGIAAAWETAEASRAGVARAAWSASTQTGNLGSDPTQAQLDAMYALPADSKSASKLPHHMCGSDGTVGEANPDGCTAGIGAINGARGGLTGVSAADLKKAYTHLAGHLTDAGLEAPEFNASALATAAALLLRSQRDLLAAAAGTSPGTTATAAVAAIDAGLSRAAPLLDGADLTALPGPVAQALGMLAEAGATAGTLLDLLTLHDGPPAPEPPHVPVTVDAAGNHPACAETHIHPHPAFGSQGSDATHGHEHTHGASGAPDANHDHHGSASATGGAGNKEGATHVDFTEDQLAVIRARLGKAEGEDITPAEIAAAFAPQPAAGEGLAIPEGSGLLLVDQSVLQDWQKRAEAGDAAATALRMKERDEVLATAMREGKFPQARLPHYQQAWALDPEGTRRQVAALAAGLVPMVGPVGVPGFDPEMPGTFEDQAAYAKLYPEDVAAARAARQAAANGGVVTPRG